MLYDALNQFARIPYAAGCVRLRFWMYDHNRSAE
jgi:hypothetical protein